MGKKWAAIVGQGATVAHAPFDDPDWEIWGMAWIVHPRDTLLFDIHHPNFKDVEGKRQHINRHTPEYIAHVDGTGLPIICHPEAKFKNGIHFPYAEVQAMFPNRDVLESTVSYMMAYAMLKGYERIGLWGCHFIGDMEYLYQLPSVTYLMGVADALGIDVYSAVGGPLMVSGYTAGMYGIDQGKRIRFQPSTLDA